MFFFLKKKKNWFSFHFNISQRKRVNGKRRKKSSIPIPKKTNQLLMNDWIFSKMNPPPPTPLIPNKIRSIILFENLQLYIYCQKKKKKGMGLIHYQNVLETNKSKSRFWFCAPAANCILRPEAFHKSFLAGQLNMQEPLFIVDKSTN